RVGVRSELREQPGVVEAGTREVGRDTECPCLFPEQLAISTGGERNDAVVVGVAADDVEGLGPDGAGRPQDDDAASHPISLRADPVDSLTATAERRMGSVDLELN